MEDIAHKDNRVIFVNAKRVLLYVVVLTCCISVLIGVAIHAQANIVATVLPSMYSVSGSTIADNEMEGSSHIQYEYVWENFNVGMNEGENINSILLKFSWSFVEPLDEIAPTTSDADQSTTSENTSSTDSTITSENDFSSTTRATPLIIEKDTGSSLPQEIENPVLNTPNESNDDNEFQDVSLNKVKLPLVFGQFEENYASTTAENLSDTVSSTALEQEPADSPQPLTQEMVIQKITLFEVLYSLDGQEWKKLNESNFSTANEIEFSLPQFSSEEIQNLKIMIRYVKNQNEDRKIYFDNVHLIVDYESTITDDLFGEKHTLVDQEPNFAISAIVDDVQSGNVRAVIIEKGGMLELWYSMTDSVTQKVTWNKLLNDASLDKSSPLEIKGKTIFWLDKNKQTLFGFDIDNQSIFGDSIDSLEQTPSTLQFEDENAKRWNASFDFDNNSLEFSRLTSVQ